MHVSRFSQRGVSVAQIKLFLKCILCIKSIYLYGRNTIEKIEKDER
jgi:hypothetical protein